VLLPRAREDRRLEFAGFEDPSLLVAGAFGALEPPDNEPGVALLAEDLVLLPGVAFDRRGRRLGRGGGWYDRSLPPLVRRLFGLAYSFQIVEEVPVTALDQCVAGIFTEAGFHCCMPSPREPVGDSS
jgi:5-formyltetrahydrofolate cyclo-ligase